MMHRCQQSWKSSWNFDRDLHMSGLLYVCHWALKFAICPHSNEVVVWDFGRRPLGIHSEDPC